MHVMAVLRGEGHAKKTSNFRTMRATVADRHLACGALLWTKVFGVCVAAAPVYRVVAPARSSSLAAALFVMPLQTEAERARRARMKGKESKPMIKVEVEYLGEDFEVEIICPKWAMHKLNGGEPSDAFEEEGGESMWELYVKDNGEAKAKRVFEERAAKETCARLRAPRVVL